MAVKLMAAVVAATLCLTLHASPDGDVDAEQKLTQICHNSGVKIGLESAALTSMVSQCTHDLNGRVFDTDEPMTDEDVYTIEEQCSAEAQTDDGEDFDSLFEGCAAREVIALLERISV